MNRWETEFVRTITNEELKVIQSGKLKKALAVIGEAGNKAFTGVGDTHRRFEETPVQNGLYRLKHDGKTTAYYAVASVLEKDLAFCYSVY